MSLPVEQGRRSFEFDRDTFAFPHELVWRYRFDPVTGAMTVVRSDPPPAYYHRCFVMVRTVRQFFNHARFESGQPEIREESYRRLVREVVSRNPRQGCAEDEKVIIPGHEGLRAFSRKRETLLKAECGGPFVSYCLRSHWRMVFPISRSHQERMARQLKQSLHERGVSLVHLFRFPRITINHGIALFGAI